MMKNSRDTNHNIVEEDNNNEILKAPKFKKSADSFLFKYFLSCTAATIAETSWTILYIHHLINLNI